MRNERTGLFILMIISYSVTMGQDDPMARGRDLYNQEKWLEAAESFGQVTKEDYRNGQAWFWLGLSRYQAGKYEIAMAALMQANKLETYPPFTRFAMARCFARMGEQDEAFSWLEQSAEAGFGDLKRLDDEEAFASMRSKLQMEGVRRMIQRNTRPTEYDDRYRVMDFWIGEWDVFDGNGTKVGTNVITKEIGGAMLLERWTNATGIQGASINYFDPGTGTFKQQWVSQSGYNTSYEGEWANGSMVMIGVNADMKGVVTKNRMTFTPNPDGTVTQFIETYNDSTKAWTQSFLGTYKRKAQQ